MRNFNLFFFRRNQKQRQEHHRRLSGRWLEHDKELHRRLSGRRSAFPLPSLGFQDGLCAEQQRVSSECWQHPSHASKQIKAGEVGAICRVDAASYFVVAWKGEPYMLQEEARGVECMLEAGTPVADAVLYHPVQHELGLYTPTTVEVIVEVSNVLRTGLSFLEAEAQAGRNMVCIGKAMTNALMEAAAQPLEYEIDGQDDEGIYADFES